jgi:hypothetical protein
MQVQKDEAASLAQSLIKKFHVLPIYIGWNAEKGKTEKRPATRHGFLDATDNAARLEELFARPTQRPDGWEWGVALVPGKSGYVVVDIDDMSVKSALPLSDTAFVQTASGGEHHYYKKLEDVYVTNSSPWRGVDIRADNGYVVAPGTTTEWGEWSATETRAAQCPHQIWERLSTSEQERHIGHWVKYLPDKCEPEDVEYVELLLSYGWTHPRVQNDCIYIQRPGKGQGTPSAMIGWISPGVAKYQSSNSSFDDVLLPLTRDERPEWTYLSGAQEPSVWSLDELKKWLNHQESRPLLAEDSPAFHGLLGEYARLLHVGREADPGWILLAAVTGCGFLIGPYPFYSMGGSKQRANLFAVAVGSSSSRKSAPWDEFYRRCVVEALKHTLASLPTPRPSTPPTSNIKVTLTEKEQKITEKAAELRATFGVLSGSVSGEALIRKIKEYTNLDMPMLYDESEFGTLLTSAQRDGMTLGQELRKAYDGKRLSYNSQAKGDFVVEEGHYFCLYSNITPIELANTMTKNEAANGFGNRFLWCYGDKRHRITYDARNLAYSDEELADMSGEDRALLSTMRGSVATIDEARLGEICKEIIKRCDEASNRGEVRMSPSAYELFDTMCGELDHDHPTGLADALIARGGNHVVRLSLVYALMDNSKLIQPVHLKAAWAMWQHCRNSIVWLQKNREAITTTTVHGVPFEKELQGTIDRIVVMLQQSPEGLSRSAIAASIPSKKRFGAFTSKAIDALLEANRVTETVQQTGERGRPSQVIRLRGESQQ